MTIRTASPDDLGAVAMIERKAFPFEPHPAFFFRQALDLWSELLLVADTGTGALAGYSLGAPSLQRQVGWILSAAVDPDSRGGGLGTALSREMLTRMRNLDMTEVRLTVHPENASAIRLYERCGFAKVAEENGYFGSDEPRFLMSRSL